MVGKSPRLPGSGLAWSLTVFLFIVAVSVPGIAYATLDGQRRTVVLLWVIAAEVVLVGVLGLFLRLRAR